MSSILSGVEVLRDEPSVFVSKGFHPLLDDGFDDDLIGVATCPRCGRVKVVEDEGLELDELDCVECGICFDLEEGDYFEMWLSEL